MLGFDKLGLFMLGLYTLGLFMFGFYTLGLRTYLIPYDFLRDTDKNDQLSSDQKRESR